MTGEALHIPAVGEMSEAELVIHFRDIGFKRVAQQLKNEQARRELAPVSLISWTLSKVGSQIAAVLESIPLKIKTVAPNLTAAQIELIKREIVKCQNVAADVQVNIDEYFGTNPGASQLSDEPVAIEESR